MNPEPDPQWESAIDRALKRLPELEAPDTLAPRVMAALRQRAAVRWYSQPWPMWPAAMRALSLAVMLAFFAGLCVAGWKLSGGWSVAEATQNPGGWISRWNIVWSTLSTLTDALKLTAGRLGTGIIIAFLAAAAISYAACVGLGTVFMRFAFVRSRN